MHPKQVLHLALSTMTPIKINQINILTKVLNLVVGLNDSCTSKSEKYCILHRYCILHYLRSNNFSSSKSDSYCILPYFLGVVYLNHNIMSLTLVMLNPNFIPCQCKQCRSRSVGFFRGQLIRICTVCY